jgi:Domain of unknown function (DUF4158)
VLVEFLTDEQAAAVGRFTAAPSQAELERFFLLADADPEQVALRRGAHNRLGFSVQPTVARYLGTFLADPTDVPTEVLDFLAQLRIADPSCIKQYAARPATQWSMRPKSARRSATGSSASCRPAPSCVGSWPRGRPSPSGQEARPANPTPAWPVAGRRPDRLADP